METIITGYIGIIRYTPGFYWENGKENGNYNKELYRDYRVYIYIHTMVILRY